MLLLQLFDVVVEGVDVEEDDIPFEDTKPAKPVTAAKPASSAPVTPSAKPASSHDDKVLALINGLNDI